MSEWRSYSLSDFLMFSTRTYYRLLEQYNFAVWPAHLLAAAFALTIIAGAVRGGAAPGRSVAGLLALCWLWVAWAFHAQRYATINTAANYFAAAFAVEALLLLWIGGLREGVELASWRGGDRRAAFGVLLFAVLGYPLLALAGGRPWRQMEVFGIAPDPTAVATLAVLASAVRPPWLLLPIPLLWCAVSGATLATMHAPDAAVAPLAALFTLLLAAAARRARR